MLCVPDETGGASDEGALAIPWALRGLSKDGVLAALVDSVGGETQSSMVEGVGVDEGALSFEVLLVAVALIVGLLSFSI